MSCNMLKNSLENNPDSTRSVNISIIKPNGISGFWNWFTNKNKKANLQNLMYDKKIKVKLNAEELDALKRNGIDLKKLQNAALNDQKMGKNIFILSKNQTELNKNDLLNNSILCDLMKNKDASKKTRKYKKSLVSSSTMSIKSKSNVLNSNITYIHSIKSKKSIVNSVSSKVSLKVGLKSNNTGDPTISPMNKNILMKGIPEAFLKGNMQKKVFVPIYLGKKKSSRTNKGEKNKNVETKSKPDPRDDSNMIPLLLTKLKTMEEQISDIENTTNKINEAVSQKDMFKAKITSKVCKDSPTQPNSKGIVTHKMYPKRSLRKFKQNKSSKSKADTPNESSFTTEFSSSGDAGKKNFTVINSSTNQIKNIKDILDNPENLLKYHTFTIPSNLSEKTLFKANPDAGCDVILKLFKALSENNNTCNETSTDDTETDKEVKNINANINILEETELSSQDKPTSFSSISESQMDLINNKTDVQKINCSQEKKNNSCPSSRTVIHCNDKTDELKLASQSSSNFRTNNNDQACEVRKNEMSQTNNQIKEVKIDNKDENEIKKPENKPFIFFSKKYSEVDKEKIESLITNEMFKVVTEGEINNRSNPSSLNRSMEMIEELMEKNNIKITNLKADKLFGSRIRTTNDDLKLGKNNSSKEVKLQVGLPKDQEEKQIIKLPILADSKNICSICIEQSEDLGTGTSKQLEVEDKGTILSIPDEKKEPKFSITILVKNNLNDEALNKNDMSMNNNESNKHSFITFKDNQPGTKILKDIFSDNQENDHAKCQGIEKTVDFNSKKYVPPLKLETSEIPKSCAFTDNSNIREEKGLHTLNLTDKKDKFGIEGVAYLNQEQRNRFDQQLSKTVISNTSQEIIKNITKPGTKSSTDLRHLSESSVNTVKSTASSLFKQSTQANGKTTNRSNRICRRTHCLQECSKERKENNVSNKEEAKDTNNNLMGGQSIDCIDRDVMRNKPRFYIISNDRDSKNNKIGHYNIGPSNKTIIASNDKSKTGNKQEFFVVNNNGKSVNRTEDLRNVGVSNSYYIKKRSYRCHMTLNQDTTFKKDLHYDKMSIGDHESKKAELIYSNEAINGVSKEKIEKSNPVVNPLVKEALNTNFNGNINKVLQNELTDQSNIMITCHSKTSISHGSELASSSAPETLKSKCILDKTNSTKPNVSASPQSKMSVILDDNLALLPESKISKCCLCIHGTLNTKNNGRTKKNSTGGSNVILHYRPKATLSLDHGVSHYRTKYCSHPLAKVSYAKLNNGTISQSNVIITSEPKNQNLSKCESASLSVLETSKCCICGLASISTIEDIELDENLPGQPNVVMNSESKRSIISECAGASLSLPEIPKCPCLAKMNTTSGKKVNSNFVDQPNTAVNSESKGLIVPERASTSVTEYESPKRCPCALAHGKTTNDNKVKENLINQSNAVVNAELKGPVTLECSQASLSVSGSPKCCPCVLAYEKTANDSKVNNDNLINPSNTVVNSELKGPVTLECSQASLSVSGSPKCCPCILAYEKTTNDNKIKENLINQSNAVVTSEMKRPVIPVCAPSYSRASESSKCCPCACEKTVNDNKVDENLINQSNALVNSGMKRSVLSERTTASSSVSELPKCSPCVSTHEITANRNEINANLINQSSAVVNSQSKKSVTSEDSVLPSSLLETPKRCPSTLNTSTQTDVYLLKGDSTDEVNDIVYSQSVTVVNSESKRSVICECASASSTVNTEVPKSCPSTLAKVNTIDGNTVNKNSIYETSVVNSESKSSDMPNYSLTSLPVSEMPKCCACILAIANTASETTVLSQAEILLERAGPVPNKVGKIMIICNKCVAKPENVGTDTKSLDTTKETLNNSDIQSTHTPDQDINEHKVSDVLLESVNRKHKITTGFSINNKLIRSESLTSIKENKSSSFAGTYIDEIPDVKLQNKIKHEGDNQTPCLHPCLATPSEDSVSSDSSENKLSNAFCLETVSDSDASNKYNIGNGIINYYSDKNKTHSLENILTSTTILDFHEKEKDIFCQIISDETPVNLQEVKNDNITKYTEQTRENRREGNVPSLVKVNFRHEDLYKADEIMFKTPTQIGGPLNWTQRNIGREKNKIDVYLPAETSKTSCSGLIHNRQHQYLAEINKNKGVKKDSYKSFKGNVLKTIKENDPEKISHDNTNNFQHLPSQAVSSTNYVVHSVEYDLMSKSGNSIIACSLNSYSSTSSEILETHRRI